MALNKKTVFPSSLNWICLCESKTDRGSLFQVKTNFLWTARRKLQSPETRRLLTDRHFRTREALIFFKTYVCNFKEIFSKKKREKGEAFLNSEPSVFWQRSRLTDVKVLSCLKTWSQGSGKAVGFEMHPWAKRKKLYESMSHHNYRYMEISKLQQIKTSKDLN